MEAGDGKKRRTNHFWVSSVSTFVLDTSIHCAGHINPLPILHLPQRMTRCLGKIRKAASGHAARTVCHEVQVLSFPSPFLPYLTR